MTPVPTLSCPKPWRRYTVVINSIRPLGTEPLGTEYSGIWLCLFLVSGALCFCLWCPAGHLSLAPGSAPLSQHLLLWCLIRCFLLGACRSDTSLSGAWLSASLLAPLGLVPSLVPLSPVPSLAPLSQDLSLWCLAQCLSLSTSHSGTQLGASHSGAQLST